MYIYHHMCVYISMYVCMYVSSFSIATGGRAQAHEHEAKKDREDKGSEIETEDEEKKGGEEESRVGQVVEHEWENRGQEGQGP